MHPTAHIDLDALVANYRFLCEKAAGVDMGAAVKANAYGLGAPAITQALFNAGARTFFTAHVAEALELANLKAENIKIVVLHGLQPSEFSDARLHNIIPTLNDLGALEKWRAFAKQTGRKLPAHIHLDSGMNRLGLSAKEQTTLIENPALLDGIDVRSWMTHYARSEEFDNPMTTAQRNRFFSVIKQLPKAPACLCNSSGLFWGKDYSGDIARPGIALYGGNPTPHAPNPMRPVLELQAPLLQVREVDAGETVGYGATHRLTRKGRVATLALGYADGYLRTLANKGFAKIGSFLAPLIGRVSMDLITLDITDVPEQIAHVGARASLIGPHRPLDQIAEEAGSINYVILTSLGPRVERIYHGNISA